MWRNVNDIKLKWISRPASCAWNTTTSEARSFLLLIKLLVITKDFNFTAKTCRKLVLPVTDEVSIGVKIVLWWGYRFTRFKTPTIFLFLSLFHCPSMDEMYNMLSENYFVIILTLGFVLLSDKKIIRQWKNAHRNTGELTIHENDCRHLLRCSQGIFNIL